MSHLVTIKTELRDKAAIQAACTRLKLPVPVHGRHKLYAGEVEGMAVNLPDWTFPVVCDTETGEIKYDNFGGRWGDEKHLNAFKQSYAIEKAKIEARKKGYTVSEVSLPNGAIKLTVRVES